MAKRKISPFQYFLYILEYIVVVPLGFFLRLLPRNAAYFIGDMIARLVFALERHYKSKGYASLDIIFKDKPLSVHEKEEIMKKLYRNIVRYGIEYLKLGRVTDKNYKKYVTLEGLENIDKALALGKGLLFVTAHFGNWEYLGSVPAKLGKIGAVIINRQFNPFTDVWIKNIREKKGKVKCFYNEVGDIKQIIDFLKKGGIVGFAVDQTYYFKPIFVPFFNLQSATANGPARFHLKYGAPIMMAFSIRQPDGKYLLKYEEAVSFPDTGNFDEDCKTIMTWINKRYEEYIIKYPDQWFSLIHGRWERNKPEDFKDIEWNPY